MSIYDTEIELRVVIGQTRMEIKDVLKLSEGSIVELEKYHNEPVDIYVNNILYAKGRVVSVDDNFGVRITHIVRNNKDKQI